MATRDIFEEEGLVERSAAMSPKFLDALFAMKDIPVVTNIRGHGLLGALDLAPRGAPGQLGPKVTQDTFEAGLMLKMTGDCALVSPPLICEESHIDELFTKLRAVLTRY